MFPFLIGRIKSKAQEEAAEAQKAFPFLIGRIKSKAQEEAAEAQKAFPFLIGRIKSRWFIGLISANINFHSL